MKLEMNDNALTAIGIALVVVAFLGVIATVTYISQRECVAKVMRSGVTAEQAREACR